MSGPAFLDSFGVEIQLGGAVLCQEDGTPLTQEDGSPLIMDGYGFVDVTPDVLGEISWNKGKLDPRTDSRVAGIGDLKIELNNSAFNSAGLPGYYSPGHANCREGFLERRGIRLYIEYDGVRLYKWQGFISLIKPVPGIHGPRRTYVECQSMMIVYHESPRQGLEEIQMDVRSDEMYEEITMSLDERPPSWAWSPNRQPISFVFAGATSKKSPASAEINKVALSAWDLILEVGNSQHGGRIISKTYADLLREYTVDATLDNEMTALDAGRAREEQKDSAVVVIVPREVGETPEVLWQLDKAEYIRPGETHPITMRYRDPNGGASIAGVDVEIDPQPGVDYYFDSIERSLAGSMNSFLQVEVVRGATQAEVFFTNTSTRGGYLNNYWLWGKAVRSFSEIELIEFVENAKRDAELRVTLAYQPLAVFGTALAQVLRDEMASNAPMVRTVAFNANRSETHMEYAMLEPSAVAEISESQTGVGNWLGMIVGESGRIYGGGLLDITWTMLMLPPQDTLLIGVTGRCEIDGSHVMRGV
ncbi:MAG: hypothetical protein KIT08_01275 [Anaerolineales bacterium]|nr:MAG: hypothetical protein KIT08_01275 [Anaerolineales bacterium]